MSDEIRFRPACADDLPAIVAMLFEDPLGRMREVISDPVDRAYIDAFEAMARDPNQVMAVAEAGSARVVGCLQLTFIPGLSHRGAWRAQIESVRVSSELRGQGIGAAFIRWAIERARERGCRMVQLTSSKSRAEAQRFYLGLGFEQSHNGYKLTLQDDL